MTIQKFGTHKKNQKCNNIIFNDEIDSIIL